MCDNCEVDILIIANISSEHIPLITKKLNQEQFYFTRISSSGGLLLVSTNTLLIGIQQERYDALMALLYTYCKKQRTHIATQTQMEAHFQPSQPIIIEAETGGATILTLPVEHYEQY
jgi:uncharacterized protein YaaQ